MSFPQKSDSTINIPIFFYCDSFDNKFVNTIIESFNPQLLSTADKLIEIFSKFEYYNFIKIENTKEDIVTFKEYFEKKQFVQVNNTFSGFFEEDEYKDILFKKEYKLLFYLITKNDYVNNIVKDINILNINGKFYFFNNFQLNDFIKNSLSGDSINHYLYPKEFDQKNGISGYNDLDLFVKFLLKNSKILFLSKKENYKVELDINNRIIKKETYYTNVEDIKEISLRNDIDAIIRYSTVCNNLNIYHDSSVWSEHFLYKTTDGVSVVDRNFTILYANEKRRQRHKNNILGKKCYNIFGNTNNICNECTLKTLFNADKLIPNTAERKELSIKDKANNEYYLIEYNTIGFLKVYKEKIGISACKDINFRYKITELSKKIQNSKTKKEIFNEIKETFLTLGFNCIRIYENYKLDTLKDIKYSPAMVLVDKSDKDKIDIGEIITADNLNEKVFLFEDEAVSMMEYFDKSRKQNTLKIFDINHTIDSDFKKLLQNKIRISEQWIDLPLWCGDKLIGTIALDYDDEKYKWQSVNEDIKYQLLHASVFLASALLNANLNLRNNKYVDVTKLISEIDRNKNVYDQFCEVILQKEDEPKNIFSIFYRLENEIFQLSNSYNNGKFNIIQDENKYKKSDNVLLDDDCGKIMFHTDNLSKFIDIDALVSSNPVIKDINSVIDIYYKSHNKTYGILRIIKTGKNVFPFSHYDYGYFKMTCNQIADIFYGVEQLQIEKDNKEKYRKSLVHALKTPISSIANLISGHSKYLYRIKNIDDFYNINEEIEEKIKIKKYNLYKTFINLKNASETANLYVKSIDSLDLTKYSFKGSINLKNIINDLCYLIRFTVENSNKNGLKINFVSILDYNIYVKGDEDKLKIAFFNILDNAYKYSLKTPLFDNNAVYKPIFVRTRYEQTEKRYEIVITNYGCVVDNNETQNVFREDYRGQNADEWNIDGKGIGLHICKKIFEAHYFTIEMRTFPDEYKTDIIVGINIKENEIIEIIN